MKDRRANLLNLALLQLAAAVPLALAASGRASLGVGLAWAAVGGAIVLSKHRGRDARLLLAGALVGGLGEGAAAVIGAMRFATPWLGLPISGWLLPSWALLGTATAYALAPLRGRLALGFLVGVVFGGLGLWGAVAAGEIVIESRAGPATLAGLCAWLGGLVVVLLAAGQRLAGTSPVD